MMKSNLIKALSPIMCLSKMLGLSRFSCRVNSESMLYSSGSMWCALMDVVQMIVYLMCTYVALQQPVFFFRYVNLTRYWLILATMRFREEKIIKVTNGILEFDRKWSMLPATTAWRTPSPRFWSLLIAVYLVYYTWIMVYMHMYVMPNFNASHMVEAVFTVPRITDFAVTIALCFYLHGLASRFSALNAFWKRSVTLAPSAAAARTAHESAVLVECVRLLHAELSDLLRAFNQAYGPVLLAFFGAVMLDMTFHCIIVLFATEMRLAVLPAVALDVQNVTFMVAVLGCTTRVTHQKKRIILLLRHTYIANISKDIQIQIQFFINQISSYELNETLACGLFDYNLTFCIPIVILLIKINSTMIQMEEQPYLKKIIYDIMNNGPWNE